MSLGCAIAMVVVVLDGVFGDGAGVLLVFTCGGG